MTQEAQEAGPAAPDTRPTPRSGRAFLFTMIALAVLLAAMFYDSYLPGWVLFSNDSPAAHVLGRAPYSYEDLSGAWQSWFWIGGEEVSNRLTLSWIFHELVGALATTKFYAPFSLLFLGGCAFVFFRQLRLHPMVCALGAFAAALNMNAFSNACWGLSAWVMARGMVYLALAALVAPGIKRNWLRHALAGFAVGMGVMEGFDMGAIFSVYVAVAAVAIHWIVSDEKCPQPAGQRLGVGVGWAAAMACCAFLLAGQGVISLLQTQVKDVEGAAQDEATKKAQWDFATRWSLPKRELIRVAIPGAYGYRMDTPDGGNYWGMVGRALPLQDLVEKYPTLGEEDQQKVRAYLKLNAWSLRHSGSGEHAGVLVLALALWALLQSFRREGPFTLRERRFIWLWAACALFSVLMAFGRYGPLYGIAYELPYFSAIRNPIKFMQAFHVAVVILFAFGLQDLWKRYLQPEAAPEEASTPEERIETKDGDDADAAEPALVAAKADEPDVPGEPGFGAWWRSAGRFERRWTAGSVGIAIFMTLGFMLFATSKPDIVERLTLVGFQAEHAGNVIDFSVREWAMFLGFLFATLIFVFLIVAGRFQGRNAAPAWALLAFLLIADLGRSNGPWIRYENYFKEYATNDILDILKKDAHEHRVALAPYKEIAYLSAFRQDYIKKWMNEAYRYHNIQSLDVPQEPRVKEEKAKFKDAVGTFVTREYELTNTRFMIGVKSVIRSNGPVDFVSGVNDHLDPEKRRFRMHTPFVVEYDEESYPTARKNDSGPLALIEFTGALPRALLLNQWELQQDLDKALERVVDPAFDPHKSVVITGNAPVSIQGLELPEPQPVDIVSYTAHRIVLHAKADNPAILLLNDGWHEDWHAYVNGEPADILRANYLMRGVYLNPGEYDVEFRFEPVSNALYLSGAALLAALGLAGYAGFSARRREAGILELKPDPSDELDPSDQTTSHTED